MPPLLPALQLIGMAQMLRPVAGLSQATGLGRLARRNPPTAPPAARSHFAGRPRRGLPQRNGARMAAGHGTVRLRSCFLKAPRPLMQINKKAPVALTAQGGSSRLLTLHMGSTTLSIPLSPAHAQVSIDAHA